MSMKINRLEIENVKRIKAVNEVSDLLCVSRSRAYKIMHQLNKELEEKGKITSRGRVSSKYLLERTTV